MPLDWATTQNNRGIALWKLGERESGTVHLEQAVAAVRLALQERTRERRTSRLGHHPEQPGIVLQALRERESGTAHLEQAVEAYQLELGYLGCVAEAVILVR